MKRIYTMPEIKITVIASTDVIALSSAGVLSKDNVTAVEKSVINF